MKEKLKDVKFWISIGSGITLILSFVTNNFGCTEQVFIEVYSCILAVLSVIGVFGKSDNTRSLSDICDDIKTDIRDESKSDIIDVIKPNISDGIKVNPKDNKKQ